ncbi:MAG: Lrp/AsnC family transcriptional regulator [Candidatus Diapherotrites archaeon]|nr:Lrp/AsnC family transcriptional regulator [Candidatus Diapherotrites archaeon]
MTSYIDSVDIAILRVLLKNARASFREIASEVGIAVGTVQNRVRKMEKMGVLQGFEPIIDYSKLGYDVDAIIALKIKRDKIENIRRMFRETPNVMSMYEVTGDVDVFLRVKFKSSSELAEFLINKLSEEYVKSSVTYTVLRRMSKKDLIR